MEAALCEGCQAVIVGLVKKHELNGRDCLVKQWLPYSARWRVISRGSTFDVKAENLALTGLSAGSNACNSAEQLRLSRTSCQARRRSRSKTPPRPVRKSRSQTPPRVRATVDNVPLRAIWFEEKATENHGTWYVRMPRDIEKKLCDILASALASRGGALPLFLQQLQLQCSHLCGETLRCVPLDGLLAKVLPEALLGSPGVSFVRLPRPGFSLTGLDQRARRAEDVLNSLIGGSGRCVFKIGMTCTPLWTYFV